LYLTHKYQTQMKMDSTDKHSSVFFLRMTQEKKFDTIDHLAWTEAWKVQIQGGGDQESGVQSSLQVRHFLGIRTPDS